MLVVGYGADFLGANSVWVGDCSIRFCSSTVLLRKLVLKLRRAHPLELSIVISSDRAIKFDSLSRCIHQPGSSDFQLVCTWTVSYTELPRLAATLFEHMDVYVWLQG